VRRGGTGRRGGKRRDDTHDLVGAVIEKVKSWLLGTSDEEGADGGAGDCLQLAARSSVQDLEQRIDSFLPVQARYSTAA